jgi:hypothetical protein
VISACRWALAALALASATCHPYGVCRAPAGNAALPERLSQTGLWANAASRTIAKSVLAYRPSFELWADGATKRRWVQLPGGGVINTDDMDSWAFPVGTKFWKELSIHGRPVETRLLERVYGGDWLGVAYVWSADGADAVAAPGGVVDVAGTEHEVPSAGDCHGCHGGRESYVLGFSALQLAHPPASGEINLDGLAARGMLSRQPHRRFTVSGDEPTREALGYLHANCGHCHNNRQPRGKECFTPNSFLDLWLQVDRLGSPEETPTYATAIPRLIVPGAPEESPLVQRMERAGPLSPPRMAPLGAGLTDEKAVGLIRHWIAGMKP